MELRGGNPRGHLNRSTQRTLLLSAPGAVDDLYYTTHDMHTTIATTELFPRSPLRVSRLGIDAVCWQRDLLSVRKCCCVEAVSALTLHNPLLSGIAILEPGALLLVFSLQTTPTWKFRRKARGQP
jgi:hypothetical protein